MEPAVVLSAGEAPAGVQVICIVNCVCLQASTLRTGRAAWEQHHICKRDQVLTRLVLSQSACATA